MVVGNIQWQTLPDMFQLFSGGGSRNGRFPPLSPASWHRKHTAPKLKQTCKPPTYVLFDTLGNWYMRGAIDGQVWRSFSYQHPGPSEMWRALLCSHWMSGGADGTGKVVWLLRKWSSFLAWNPGEYWVTVWETFDSPRGQIPLGEPHPSRVQSDLQMGFS